jgi:Flp pilus assembly protein TadG
MGDALGRAARGWGRDRSGAAAVEFSLLLPAFCVILVGSADLGAVLYTKFKLNSAVSAAANYALVKAENVNGTSGQSLANSLAAILSGANTSATTTGTIVVNNGPSATITASGTASSGTAANANSCYCPTLSGGALSWGSAQTCGVTCASGGIAGRYVTVTAQQAYTPHFSNYGIVRNNSISARAVVQVQ